MTLGELIALLRCDLRRLRDAPGASAGRFRRALDVFNPRFGPVLLVRCSQWLYGSRWTRPFAMLFSLLNVVLFGLEYTPRCPIGPGLFLPHTSGTVIGAARIGANVTIFQGVTLGAKAADLAFVTDRRPTIGDNVVVGAGAKVLGGIHVGDGAVIAANSLVLEDVAPGATMIGVPATPRTKS